MAIDFNNVDIIFKINGIRIINNAVVVGTMNGNTREALFSFSFTESIGQGKVKCDVVDSNGKNVFIDFNDKDYTGKFLFNGTYNIKVTLYEEQESKDTPPNEKIFVLKDLTVTGCYTTLSSFNPEIVDKLTGVIIKDGDIFSDGQSVIPDLDQELPFDFAIDEYRVTRNGLVIAYNPYGDRTIKDNGEYTIKITVKRRGTELNGDIMVKSFTRKFSIEKSFISTIQEKDIYIFNSISNSAILNGYKYIEKDIVVDWSLAPGIEVKSCVVNFYKDAKEGHIKRTDKGIEIDADFQPILLGNFERGATILNKYGIYKMDFLLVESSNSKNKLNMTRYFLISREIITLHENLLNCYDVKNEQIVKESFNNILTSENVTPLISYDEDLDGKVVVDVVAQFNGEEFKDFDNGETILNIQGVYTLKGRVYEKGTVDEDIKNQYTRTFTFCAVNPPRQLDSIHIDLIENESKKIVLNGTTFNEKIEGYNFIINNIKDSEVIVSYEHTDIMGVTTKSDPAVISSKNPLHIIKPGTYLVRLKIYDKTLNPMTNELQYPYNVYEKAYVFNIFKEAELEYNDPDKMVYINGQLLDASRKNPIWNSLSVDSTELNFSFTKPGSYNIITVNKNTCNFNYSMSEYDILVVNPNMQQKPTIISDPATNVSVVKSFKVFITYPSSAAKNTMMYKDEYSDNKEWQIYPKDGIVCTKACKIFGKYRDSASGDWVENSESEAFTPGPPIDNSPVFVPDEDIIGIKNNHRYYAVTIDIKRKLNYKYTPYILYPDQREYVECKLGTLIKKEGVYKVKFKVENTVNGNTGESNQITFTIDHTDPVAPVILLTDSDGHPISNNGETNSTVSIELESPNLEKYFYEGYLNNRLLFKTIDASTSIVIPKVMRDGNYSLTVVAIDKESGRRNMTHSSFKIVSRKVVLSGAPIKPHRYREENNKFFFKDNIIPYDGELLLRCDSSWRPLGDVGIYRDGLVINKFVELDGSILQLSVSTDEVENDVITNRAISDSLSSIKKELYYSLMRMMIENSKLNDSVSFMLDYCEEAQVPELDPVVNDRIEKDAVYNLAKENNRELNRFTTKTFTKTKEKLEKSIEALQQNTDAIGEIKHLSALYKVKNRILS